MRLYHCTSRDNVRSIQTHGLLVEKADTTAKIKGCWVCTSSNRPWAVLHTIRKHQVALDEVVVLEVTIPRRWLTRFRTGLWYTTQDVPAGWIGAITDGAAFGASASN